MRDQGEIKERLQMRKGFLMNKESNRLEIDGEMKRDKREALREIARQCYVRWRDEWEVLREMIAFVREAMRKTEREAILGFLMNEGSNRLKITRRWREMRERR